MSPKKCYLITQYPTNLQISKKHERLNKKNRLEKISKIKIKINDKLCKIDEENRQRLELIKKIRKEKNIEKLHNKIDQITND